MTTPPADIWQKISVRWKNIVRVAAIIATVVGSIFMPPPAYMTDSGEGTLVPFTRYGVAVVTALVTVAMVRWNRRKYLRWWVIATVAAFALVVGSYFTYNAQRDQLTAAGADGARVVIGSEYTAVGRAYVAHHPEARAADLLADAPCPSGGSACSATLVWTAPSIAANKRTLGLLFVLGALLLDIALLSAVQCTLI